MRRAKSMFQRNSNEFGGEFKPGGLDQAGWPTILTKTIEATSLEHYTPSLHVCKRATEFGHRCRPAGLT